MNRILFCNKLMSVGFLCAVFRQQSVGKSEVEVRSKWQNFRLIQQDDEALLIVITFTDGFGVLLVKWILLTAKVQIRNPVMTTCLEVTVSKLVVIFVMRILPIYVLIWTGRFCRPVRQWYNQVHVLVWCFLKMEYL